MGPNAVRYTRLRYNEVIRDTNDQQLLLNIVRLRYADSPVFIDLPNITSQFEVAGRGNYLGGTGNQFQGHTNLGFGELSLRDSPTLSYHPREGREIAKALLTPLSTELFSLVNAGADLEQLLLMTISDINDLPNAPAATTLVPRFPTTTRCTSTESGSSRRSSNARPPKLAVSKDDESEDASDPIPRKRGSGTRPPERSPRRLCLSHQGAGRGNAAQAGERTFLRVFRPMSTPPRWRKWRGSFV